MNRLVAGFLVAVVCLSFQARGEGELTCTNDPQKLEGNFPHQIIGSWYPHPEAAIRTAAATTPNSLLAAFEFFPEAFIEVRIQAPFFGAFTGAAEEASRLQLKLVTAGVPVERVHGMELVMGEMDMKVELPDTMELCWKGSGASAKYYIRVREKTESENWIYVQVRFPEVSENAPPRMEMALLPVKPGNGHLVRKPNQPKDQPQQWIAFLWATICVPELQAQQTQR